MAQRRVRQVRRTLPAGAAAPGLWRGRSGLSCGRSGLSCGRSGLWRGGSGLSCGRGGVQRAGPQRARADRPANGVGSVVVRAAAFAGLPEAPGAGDATVVGQEVLGVPAAAGGDLGGTDERTKRVVRARPVRPLAGPVRPLVRPFRPLAGHGPRRASSLRRASPASEGAGGPTGERSRVSSVSSSSGRRTARSGRRRRCRGCWPGGPGSPSRRRRRPCWYGGAYEASGQGSGWSRAGRESP